MKCTIDASVFVTASRPQEENYEISLAFLCEIQEQGWQVDCPTLVLPECSAAIARTTGDGLLAKDIVALIEEFSNIHLVPLSHQLSQQAADIAAEIRLRGADSIYVAVAKTSGALLVTWDKEMKNRGEAVIPTLTPDMWFREYGKR
jgi:predicted nucleic acid-binding protein